MKGWQPDKPEDFQIPRTFANFNYFSNRVTPKQTGNTLQ
jgi:hypothetical protein